MGGGRVGLRLDRRLEGVRRLAGRERCLAVGHRVGRVGGAGCRTRREHAVEPPTVPQRHWIVYPQKTHRLLLLLKTRVTDSLGNSTCFYAVLKIKTLRATETPVLETTGTVTLANGIHTHWLPDMSAAVPG